MIHDRIHELQENILYDQIGQAVWAVEGGAIDFSLLYFHSVCTLQIVVPH